jgi:hypothetical protein
MANMIEEYEFGRIRISGKDYTSDVIVFGEIVKEDWWRKEGHEVNLEDIGPILKFNPEVVVFGTGYYDRVAVKNEVLKELEKRGIEAVILKTQDAVAAYRKFVEGGKKVVLAVHLTC